MRQHYLILLSQHEIKRELGSQFTLYALFLYFLTIMIRSIFLCHSFLTIYLEVLRPLNAWVRINVSSSLVYIRYSVAPKRAFPGSYQIAPQRCFWILVQGNREIIKSDLQLAFQLILPVLNDLACHKILAVAKCLNNGVHFLDSLAQWI